MTCQPTHRLVLLFATSLCLCGGLTSTASAQVSEHKDRLSPLNTPLNLRISPQDATVTLDGKPIDASQTLYLPAGTHVFRVEAPGYIPREETLKLESQQGREILMSINLSKDPVLLNQSSQGIVDRMGTGRSITGWAMTAGGAALITTSIVLAVRSGAPEVCEAGEMTCTNARNLTGWSTFTGILGGAALLGGVTLLSWRSLAGEPAEQALDSGRVRRTARLSFQGSGLLLRVEY